MKSNKFKFIIQTRNTTEVTEAYYLMDDDLNIHNIRIFSRNLNITEFDALKKEHTNE